jgi:hypothetical protein
MASEDCEEADMSDTRITGATSLRSALMDRLELAWDARTIIDVLDDAATDVLRTHGFESWPRLQPAPEHIQAVTGNPAFPVYSMPAGTAEQAQRAARLIEVLRTVRAFLYGDGSLNDAVILGMRLGVAMEQAGLADLIPLAKRAIRLMPEANEHVRES